MAGTNPYNTTIDANNVFLGLAENSEAKWQLAKSLRAKLADEGVDVDIDQCGSVVSDVLRQVRVVLNINRPECLGSFASKVLAAISVAIPGSIPMKSAELPLLGVIEGATHVALARITKADRSS